MWGGALRGGDRSIDVYVHKLRVKLEEALPDWRFIHTHVGFGYRFSPEPSHDFHIPSHRSVTGCAPWRDEPADPRIRNDTRGVL